ncbi:major facilitator superfamily arabinose transmembrane efflux protein [Asaia spathodeae NBRC 105894]|nr:major facilitator superfamily arabinose transmembrane efflux protein [Asaia spathodeae NBRC 105894]
MIAHTFGVSDPEAGHAIVLYAAGVCIGAPAIALFSAGISRRTMLISMMLLYTLGNGLSAVAPNYLLFLVCRFISGLPHGAYFGIASILASSLVPPNKRSQAVGRVILGLTIATIGGVPLANGIGQIVGWRWAFGLIAALALCTALLIILFAPKDAPRKDASILNEFTALKIKQVWLTLAIGAVGFGSVFCVYTYLASIMIHVTQVPESYVPIMLAVFGVGMTIGTLVCAWLADHKMMPTLAGVLLMGAAAMAGFPEAAHKFIPLAINVFMIGASGGLATVVQARLLTVAVGAEGLAAALNQSAFNIANAVGPWLGGLAISAGLGWTSVGWVGLALSLGGFAIYLLSIADEFKNKKVESSRE